MSYWHVRLSATAQEDYQDILHWTVDQFGLDQARVYADCELAVNGEEPFRIAPLQ